MRFVDGRVEPRLPDGVDAEAILARAQLGDGIAGIDAHGTVTFTEPAAAAMKDILGYHCPVLRPEDALERVRELRERLDGHRSRAPAN